MEDDLRLYLDAIVARFESLREADLEATRLRRQELSRLLDGFPQDYATESQLDALRIGIERLERSALSRDVYEERHAAISERIAKLENEKLDSAAFKIFEQASQTTQSNFAAEHAAFLTVDVYNEAHRSLLTKVESVERWQYKMIGGLVFATFLAPLISALIVWTLTGR